MSQLSRPSGARKEKRKKNVAGHSIPTGLRPWLEYKRPYGATTTTRAAGAGEQACLRHAQSSVVARNANARKIVHTLRARASRSTIAKSPSALATHSRVIGFIEHLALLEDVADERIAHGQARAHLFGRPDEQVQGERRPGGQADLD